MNKSTDELSSNDEIESVDDTKSGGGWKIRLGVLCAMLVFALAGMGFTQASESGAWEYWLFVVVIYAALGLWRKRTWRETSGAINQ